MSVLLLVMRQNTSCMNRDRGYQDGVNSIFVKYMSSGGCRYKAQLSNENTVIDVSSKIGSDSVLF